MWRGRQILGHRRLQKRRCSIQSSDKHRKLFVRDPKAVLNFTQSIYLLPSRVGMSRQRASAVSLVTVFMERLDEERYEQIDMGLR